MTMDNIEPIAKLVGDLDKEIKKLQAEKKKYDAELREALADRGPQVFGDYMFEVTMSPGRKTLDKDALQEAGINLDPFYKTGAPFTTMKIKAVNQ